MTRRLAAALAALAALLSACAAPSPSPSPLLGASGLWSVEIKSSETAPSLTLTTAALQYNGGLLSTELDVTPAPGRVFLLLNLTVEKTGEGRASFSWQDAHVEDSAGNVYYRHANDTFLTSLNIPRIRSVDIVLGRESGFACFEVAEGAEGLRFLADGGAIVIALGL
jgi:hypothetical protein